MTFDELVDMVRDYAAEYGVTILESIEDVEFDGPEGGSGLSAEDRERLIAHFAIEGESANNYGSADNGLV